MKVLFILPSLKPGGAERVISFLAKNFHDNNQEVTLLVLGFEKDKVFETGNLSIVYLNRDRLLFSIFDIIKFMKKRKPKIVFSTIVHVNTVMSLISFFFKKTKFIAREASVLSVRSNYGGYKSWLFNKIISRTYKKLDAIVCQSQDMKNDFIKNFNINKNKLLVIGNPITIEKASVVVSKSKLIKKINFITVGRLSKEKGHLRLIHNLLTIKNYDFHYKIIGSGPEKDKLIMLVQKLGLVNNVEFIPFTKNINKYLMDSDFFLQGSYVEGFPNALLESCALGTPVIAYDCPGGTKEILREGENGFLVSNDKEFRNILQGLNEKDVFKRNNVSEYVQNTFSLKIIFNKYNQLIDCVTKGNKLEELHDL